VLVDTVARASHGNQRGGGGGGRGGAKVGRHIFSVDPFHCFAERCSTAL
jgi:hypothetical protein